MVSTEECIFCKIVRKEIPAFRVLENDGMLAILDINPSVLGHTLVIPKKHSATIHDIDDSSLEAVIKGVKEVAGLLKDRLGAAGVSIFQNNGRHAEQFVDHVHFHVVPRYENDGIRIHPPGKKVSQEELKSAEAKLKEEEKKEEPSMDFSW